MIASNKVISDWIHKWSVLFVENTVFNTTDPDQIATLIDDFCRRELASPVATFLFYGSSQGAVCGVELLDGRRIVLKIHQPSRSLDFLNAVIQVQHYLIASGYPCTKPLLEPKPIASGVATVEELVDEGEYRDAHNPVIRRSIAEMLAWLITLTWTPDAIPDLRPSSLDLRLPSGTTWPTPHSKLFDFEATAKGAQWIDAIARRTQEIKVQGAGQLVIGHTDWGVKHFRYLPDERVRIIYDWDSLALEKEPIIVGHAAAYFTYTEFFDVERLPSREESQAFIAEYEAARGKPFTLEERKTLDAAMIYGLAYGARCEHALKPDEQDYPEGSSRALLAQHSSRM